MSTMAICLRRSLHSAGPRPSQARRCSILAVLLLAILASSAASARRPPILPDRRLTPGDSLPITKDDICVPGYARKVRDVPISIKRQVYQNYGIPSHRPGEFEVDHLISLELGGSNSIRN